MWELVLEMEGAQKGVAKAGLIINHVNSTNIIKRTDRVGLGAGRSLLWRRNELGIVLLGLAFILPYSLTL